MEKLNKQKYLRIAKTEGANQALTVLHDDLRALEHDAFEGREGWQPKKWESLEDYRALSREIWNAAIEQALDRMVDEGQAPFLKNFGK